MSFLDLVKSRQSCRNYRGDPVGREKIERCIEAARLAPSACNSQPWRFIVVTDPDLKKELADKAFGGIYSVFSFAKKAPALIFVVRENSNYAARLGGTFRGLQYSLIDIGITVEHFVLQAQEEGLGTCWIGWFNEKAAKKVLGLPQNKKVDILITMGYADEAGAREKKRKILEEMSEFR